MEPIGQHVAQVCSFISNSIPVPGMQKKILIFKLKKKHAYPIPLVAPKGVIMLIAVLEAKMVKNT